LGTFWLKIEQFWPFEKINILGNSGHLEWRAGLSDTILKWTHPGTILSQNVRKFELYKHKDELFNMYYRIFYEL
jgi:hypothetical protein